MTRYAAGRFKRNPPDVMASHLETVYQALRESQRAPSGFNSQPYRIAVISSDEEKMLASNFACGRNADRVRDSSATVVFLSDMFTSLPPNSALYGDLLGNDVSRRKIKMLVSLFGSNFAVMNSALLTRVISPPLCLAFRLAINAYNRCLSLLHLLICPKSRVPNGLIFPTLRSSRHWATKNTMLVAMTFMLSCTSKNLQTCPMEGFNQRGMLSALRIPQPWRYEACLAVSVGTKYEDGNDAGVDDVGMLHSDPRGVGSNATKRLALSDVLLSPKPPRRK